MAGCRIASPSNVSHNSRVCMGLRTLFFLAALIWALRSSSAAGADPEPAPPPQPRPPGRAVPFPKPVPPPKPVESSLRAMTNLPLRMVRPGIFQVGQVTMDKSRRTVSFPASVNQARGPLEYLLVAKWGKTHESVFRTEVEPFQIHVAMLLLDATEVGSTSTNESAAAGGGGQYIANPVDLPFTGSRVGIEVAWRDERERRRRPAEEFVFNLDRQSVLTNASWVYNGSRVQAGRFLAQASGSIISLVTDPEAQVNNQAPGHDNDRIWVVNTNGLPGVGTPVEITLKLVDESGEKNPK